MRDLLPPLWNLFDSCRSATRVVHLDQTNVHIEPRSFFLRSLCRINSTPHTPLSSFLLPACTLRLVDDCFIPQFLFLSNPTTFFRNSSPLPVFSSFHLLSHSFYPTAIFLDHLLVFHPGLFLFSERERLSSHRPFNQYSDLLRPPFSICPSCSEPMLESEWTIPHPFMPITQPLFRTICLDITQSMTRMYCSWHFNSLCPLHEVTPVNDFLFGRR